MTTPVRVASERQCSAESGARHRPACAAACGTRISLPCLGGDEFAVVQTKVREPPEVKGRVTEIYQAIREPFDCESSSSIVQ